MSVSVASATPGPGVDAVIGYRNLPSGVLGSGGGVPTTRLELVSGDASVQSGLAPDVRRLALLHEIGHLLGLGHVDSLDEVMYSAAATPHDHYLTGDLEGMRLVGTSMPCFAPAPAPRRCVDAAGDPPRLTATAADRCGGARFWRLHWSAGHDDGEDSR